MINIKYIFIAILISVFSISSLANEMTPQYNATITRDIYGVPHVHGETDADAAFGLAYAQAEDDIKNNLTEKIAKFKQPKEVIFENELPRNSMGKVQKVELREKFKNIFLN